MQFLRRPWIHLSKESKTSRAFESIEIAQHIEDTEIKVKCLSMLYALHEKFGDENSKRRLKEVLSMTEIGKMILDEGIARGIVVGKAEGKTELLIKQLTKRFKKIPNDYVVKIMMLPEATIEIIGTEIFDIEKIEDIEKYF
jgi:phosphotransacetylase